MDESTIFDLFVLNTINQCKICAQYNGNMKFMFIRSMYIVLNFKTIEELEES